MCAMTIELHFNWNDLKDIIFKWIWILVKSKVFSFNDSFSSSAQPRRWSQRKRISVSVLYLRASALCPFLRTSPSRSAAAVVLVKPGGKNVRPVHILDLVSLLFYFVNDCQDCPVFCTGQCTFNITYD